MTGYGSAASLRPYAELLVQFYLKGTLYALDITQNGDDAVKKFTSGKYDIVLMDVQMPGMDGYEATNLIREWEAGHDAAPTPIVALTANALRGDEERSRSAGCDGHLTKPIKRTMLIEAIDEHIRKVAL